MERPKIQNTVNELSGDDWKVLRDLKIQSLTEEPLAFENQQEGQQKYLERTEEEWRRSLDHKSSNKIFMFTRESEKYVGMVSAVLNNETALIQHMYVVKNSRGLGIGKKLLEGLIARLSSLGIHQVDLQVLTTQVSAINLYTSLGFKETKRNLRSVKRGEEYYDEIEMALNI